MTVYIIAVLFALLLLTFFVWQGHHIIVVYRRTTGTPKQRFLAAFSDSLTIVVARVTAFASSTVAFIVTALPTLDPQSTTGATIAALFNPETLKWWLAALTALGLLFEWARRRPGSVDPITPPAIGTGAALVPNPGTYVSS